MLNNSHWYGSQEVTFKYCKSLLNNSHWYSSQFSFKGNILAKFLEKKKTKQPTNKQTGNRYLRAAVVILC